LIGKRHHGSNVSAARDIEPDRVIDLHAKMEAESEAVTRSGGHAAETAAYELDSRSQANARVVDRNLDHDGRFGLRARRCCAAQILVLNRIAATTVASCEERRLKPAASDLDSDSRSEQGFVMHRANAGTPCAGRTGTLHAWKRRCTFDSLRRS